MNTRALLSPRGRRFAARHILTGLSALALSACAGVIPESNAPVTTVPPAPAATPDATILPDVDEERHRVAMLVPLSGEHAAVGQSLANAATMALLDTNTANMRITSYDTAGGSAEAARKAIFDGNGLILGPLLSEDIAAVKSVAGPARVPLISFSNNSEVAGDGAYVMGQIPAQSIERTMRHAIDQGLTEFGALVPSGEYGRRASASMLAFARANGARVLGMESYDRSTASLTTAVDRLAAKGDYQAILVADGARMAVRAGPLLRDREAGARLLGTELWSGEAQIAQARSLRGAWFSAVPDGRYQRFADSYRSRFGAAPYRISTLGYDAVLLAIKSSQGWDLGERFPADELREEGGFIGLDGAFRFEDGLVRRSFEVREVTPDGVRVVSPAPTKFGD